MKVRVGQGFDVHILVESNKPLKLGGVVFPSAKALQGHSDADCLLHAICDALLGAAGMGDIGQLFPDTDLQWKNADSLELLKEVGERLISAQWSIINIDTTVLAEEPKITPYKKEMERKIAEALTLDEGQINIKATTMEKMGALGREEGIGAMTVALIYQKDG